MALTPIFAALFAFLYLYLSLSVIKQRFSKKVILGDGGDRDLQVAIRTHANFAEYVPFSLLLLWFVEAFTYSSNLVFILASILLIARVGHIVGMRDPKRWLICRQAGILATHAVIAVCAAQILWHYLPA